MDKITAKRLVAQRRGMEKVRKYCDEHTLPYPPELSSYLMEVQRYRSGD